MSALDAMIVSGLKAAILEEHAADVTTDRTARELQRRDLYLVRIYGHTYRAAIEKRHRTTAVVVFTTARGQDRRKRVRMTHNVQDLRTAQRAVVYVPVPLCRGCGLRRAIISNPGNYCDDCATR